MGRGRVEGKAALVTGASRGIGREIALTLAREGAAVGVNHLPDPEQAALASEVVDQVRQLGGKAVALPADVVDGLAMRGAVTTLIQTLGGIDVVVTNAGIIHRGPLVDVTEADWDRVVAVNLKGTFNAIHASLPHLVRQRRGKIVTIASELALIGRAGAAAYAASKAGVIGLTKSLALEFGPKGITVNAVPPGFIDTPMLRASESRGEFGEGGVDGAIARTPVRRAGLPEDVAAAVSFLCLDEAGYITGQIIGINGGRNT